MKKRKKILFYGILCFVLLFTLVACLEPMEEDKPFAEGGVKGAQTPEEKEQDQIMEEYNDLLSEDRNQENVLNFVDEHIEKLNKEYASIMIVSLAEYLEDKDYSVYRIYIVLNRYQGHISLETKSYIKLLFNEAIEPFKNEEELEIDLDKLLNRAMVSEDHLIVFSEGETREAIYELYIDYMKTAIYGLGDPYIFTKENTPILKDEVVEIYRSAMENNEDSKTSNILSKYIKVLEENNYNIDKKDIKKFHEDLDSIINKEFS